MWGDFKDNLDCVDLINSINKLKAQVNQLAHHSTSMREPVEGQERGKINEDMQRSALISLLIICISIVLPNFNEWGTNGL